MQKLRVLDLFSGIGGFSLGLERTGGFETVAFCEIEEFPRRVLAKHWPEVPCYHDVRELTADKLAADGISIDVITGGFPCQDLSIAGKKAGMGEGTRSGLWSEIDRLIGELRPQFVIVENVANLLSGPSEQPGGWFGRVLGDLAERGYNAEWENIPAAIMGAPHRRERVWIVAYPNKDRCGEQESTKEVNENSERNISPRQQRRLAKLRSVWSDRETYIPSDHRKKRTEGSQPQQVSGFSAFSWCEDVRRVEDLRGRSDIPTPLFRGSSDGIPHWVDRIGTCGNAVIPQIPELIGYTILEAIARKTEGEAA
ncbi:DNA cytosine methyltransferase [Brucella sp. 22210]|uniref:DNA cytosine methyltransferase n=1 Tax=Brucella sp. 22210 TaxID=3453892 RepID=UPI003F869327